MQMQNQIAAGDTFIARLRQLNPKWLALGIAILADTLQFALLPLFAEGVLSPFEAVLDIPTAAIMISLLGWHWAFLPSFVAELVPVLDLFPTWTVAVLYVIRQDAVRKSSQNVTPPYEIPQKISDRPGERKKLELKNSPAPR